MKLQLLTFLDDRRGGSAPEYALILAAVAGAVAIGVAMFGSSLGNGLRASAEYVDRVALNFGGPQTASAIPPAATPSHGRSSSAPGHGGPARGQSGDAPGQGGATPGKSESAPGKNK